MDTCWPDGSFREVVGDRPKEAAREWPMLRGKIETLAPERVVFDLKTLLTLACRS